ncbi:MAG: LamG domain-containing protein, partial [Bacteroidetes bacterium]|nr:LamG domain-containing protein [Bacteroidota bacterium]
MNTYSYAKIIESSANQAIIHWRYLQSFAAGNAHKEVYPDGFVDEYFTFLPDGEVRRSIRKGRKMTDEWNNPANMMSQTILLSLKGLVSSEVTAVGLEMDIKKVEGADIFEPENLNPEAILSYTFDEGLGGEVNESYSKYRSSVTGRKTLWRTGVSGTCLQFDGYYTEVRMPVDKALPINDEISLQAFIAIGAYPWSWCPIVQQADDVPENVITGRRDGNYFVEMEKEDDTGFFLGIDGDGHPGFKLRVGGVWEELYGDFHLERRQWYLLTATYSRQKHEMKIYVDEQLVGKMELQDGVVELSEKDILIGRGKERRPINPVRRNTFPGQYAFDGLIDEVKIFNHSLTDKMISEQYRLANLADAEIEMDKRIMPSGRAESGFGASYEHLKFYDIWDNLWCFSDHPDVVVGFEDNPSKFVFWRGVSYIPMMVNEKGQWYSNEFNETWGTSGGDGCQEPMSDKGNYFTYARILENTPARVVVHYRFPLADVNLVKANYVEETGWYDVADWYYYIYPDGIATKRKHLWTSGSRNHEWQESMAIFGPDQHPEDIIEKENTVHMQDMDGQSAYYNWTTAPPPNVDEPEEQCIQTVNYTGKYDPITIGEAFESSNVYGGELTPFSVFPTWNHWPVAQMASDGRYASYADRTGHSSLTHVYLPVYAEAEGDKPFYEKLLMEGMLNTDEVDLVNLARSWNHAPAIDLEGEG